MEPIVDAYYFRTVEERRTFVAEAKDQGRTMIVQGKVKPENAPEGKCYKAVFLKEKGGRTREVISEGV